MLLSICVRSMHWWIKWGIKFGGVCAVCRGCLKDRSFWISMILWLTITILQGQIKLIGIILTLVPFLGLLGWSFPYSSSSSLCSLPLHLSASALSMYPVVPHVETMMRTPPSKLQSQLGNKPSTASVLLILPPFWQTLRYNQLVTISQPRSQSQTSSKSGLQ